MRWFASLMAAFAITVSADAQSLDASQKAGLTRAEQAWRSYVAEVGATQSQFAMAYRGKIVRNASIGISETAKMPVFSLSKAVTGRCVMRLAAEGLLPLSATVGDLRARYAVALPSGSADGVTISQLLTHTSGLQPDPTQGIMSRWFSRGAEALREAARMSVGNDNLQGERGRYFYNNGNYAILGVLIEAATGRDYSEACGADAGDLILGDRFAGLSAYGGWSGSAGDYLAFANAAFGHGTEAQAAPLDHPRIALGGGAFYGPGTLMRLGREVGGNFWHYGLLCNPDPSDDGGAYFAVLGNGFSAAVTYNVCPESELATAIGNRIWRAVFDP